MPDGTLSAAKIRTFQWPTAEAPGGVRLFACQHKTRETVSIARTDEARQRRELLKQVLIVTPEPSSDAAHLSRMIDVAGQSEPDGGVAVPSGGDHADFVFLTRDPLGKRRARSIARRPARARRRRSRDRRRYCVRGKGAWRYGVRSGGGLLRPAAGNRTLLPSSEHSPTS